MKSEWKVRANWTGDMEMYQVYRLYDVQKVDEAYNREEDGLYVKKDKAEARAKELNTREAERFWEK